MSLQKQILKGNMGPPPPPAKKNKLEKSDLSPSSWNIFFENSEDVTIGTKDVFRVYRSGPKDATAFILLHGAGHTALSWALTAQEMKNGKCQVIAFDCRAHGLTCTESEDDLSVAKLVEDATNLINELFKGTTTKLIIVGHSMGGAIAAKVAASNKISNLVGLVVIDVVEGTALAALPHMHSILESRPQKFDSIESAIDWRIESAKVSIPPQLIHKEGEYLWRTDLKKTEQFWKGWFEDLSKMFLSAKAVKMLILAGTDRLDKDLTIAQMQGKFQLTMFPSVGHTIQEDDPKRTADALLQFQQRYHF